MQSGWLRASHRDARPDADRPSCARGTRTRRPTPQPLPAGRVRAGPRRAVPVRARVPRRARASASPSRRRAATGRAGRSGPSTPTAVTNEIARSVGAPSRVVLPVMTGIDVPRARRRVRASGASPAATTLRRMADAGGSAQRRSTTISDRYVERFAALDPVAPTLEGIAGHDDRDDRLLARRAEERAELARATLRALDARATRQDERGPHRGRRDARPARDRPSSCTRPASTSATSTCIGEPGPGDPQVFDLMPTDTERRLGDDRGPHGAACPQALLELRGLATTRACAQGLVAARRQVVGCVQQAETWAGTDGSSTPPFFQTLVDRFDAAGIDAPGAPRHARASGAERATAAYAAFARFLDDEYAPHADRARPGRARSATRSGARSFNGIELDLDETYEWGWDELHRIEDAMRARRASASCPASRVAAVIEQLETDPTRAIEGVDDVPGVAPGPIDRDDRRAQRRRTSTSPTPLQRGRGDDRAAGRRGRDVLHGPDARTSAAPAARGTRRWARPRFPLWGEVTTCYHEGVPGHHLQVAQVRYLADELIALPARARRASSGHGEGWALYAERLMGELGYLDDPDYELGMLARAGDARGAGHRRHRHAPRAADPRRRALPPGRDVDARAGAAVRDRAQPRSPRTSCAARSTATSAGPARRSATRSASGCGSTRATTPRGRARRRVRPEGVPQHALDLGPHGPRPARRPSSPASERQTRTMEISCGFARPATTRSSTRCRGVDGIQARVGRTAPARSTATCGSRSPARRTAPSASGSARLCSSRTCATCSCRRRDRDARSLAPGGTVAADRDRVHRPDGARPEGAALARRRRPTSRRYARCCGASRSRSRGRGSA